MIYVPLAYYYPNAPVISQINFVFDKIPFLGGSTFLENSLEILPKIVWSLIIDILKELLCYQAVLFFM
jgi:hypothetical protein